MTLLKCISVSVCVIYAGQRDKFNTNVYYFVTFINLHI